MNISVFFIHLVKPTLYYVGSASFFTFYAFFVLEKRPKNKQKSSGILRYEDSEEESNILWSHLNVRNHFGWRVEWRETCIYSACVRVFLCVSCCSRATLSSSFIAGNNILAMGEWQGNWMADSVICVCTDFLLHVCVCPKKPPSNLAILSPLTEPYWDTRHQGRTELQICLHNYCWAEHHQLLIIHAPH